MIRPALVSYFGSRRWSRREFLAAGGAVTASRFSLFSSAPAGSRAKAKPNVVIIAVDDLRPELGCFGAKPVQSPSIDRLAREGLVFTRAYCAMPICNPSRASLLTGMRPDTLGVWDNSTHFRKNHPDITTLPQLFKNAGYHCVEVGKFFHDSLPDPVSWSTPIRLIPMTTIYVSPAIRARQSAREAAARKAGMSEAWVSSYLRGPATEAFDGPDNASWDGVIADGTIDLLRKLRDKTPFFLGIGLMSPHLPFVAPKRYWDLYQRDEIPLAPNNFLPKGAPRFAMNGLTELACHEDFVDVPNPTEGSLTEDQVRLLRHGYFACVSYVDAQVGRIIDALDELNLRAETIIVLWGDNGCKLGEHGGWGKQTNYEEDTRVPLIISPAGEKRAGGETPALVELVDVYPTLCELADLRAPRGLEGTSLAPLLQNPRRPWKTAAFSQYARGFTYRYVGRAMRTDRYRYIEWRERFEGRLVAAELYDHESDPQENVNLASLPESSVLVEELSRRLGRGWKAALPR